MNSFNKYLSAHNILGTVLFTGHTNKQNRKFSAPLKLLFQLERQTTQYRVNTHKYIMLVLRRTKQGNEIMKI